MFGLLKSSDQESLARRVLREHILPYKRLFGVAILCMLIAAASTAALPALLQPAFDDVFTNGTPRLLFIVCGGIFLAFVLKGASAYGEAIIMAQIGQRIISDLQLRLFRHLMQADLAFFHGTSSGDLLSRFTNDVNLMRNAVATTLVGVGRDFLTLIGLITLMFYRDWTLAAIAFVIFPTIVFPILKIGRRMRKVALSMQDELSTFTSRLTQVFQGVRVVKAYGMEEVETHRAEDLINRIYYLICKSTRIRSAAHPIIESLGGMAIVIVIGYGGWQVMHHSRTTGEFISFIAALLLVYEPMKRLSNLNANIQEGLAAASRVFSVIDTPALIMDKPDAKTITQVTGQIEFKDVVFCYPDRSMALDHISLSVKPTQTIALVGSSGAGKSTFINLIPRFYDVTGGSISIDGLDLRDITIDSLRQHIALVSQEVMLFDSSVRENILYGTPKATEDQIIQAAKSAAAHEFICKLPMGYETPVGEHGVKLSGGQRQRIAIARAMLKNAPILLLDEATSALDTESERQVQAALKTLMEGRTTIMVAHRLSTVIEADIIYVLERGKIVESGSHQQLLEAQGIYDSLWKAQSTHTASEAA